MRTAAGLLVGFTLLLSPLVASAATLRAHAICRDHTISYSVHRQGTCSWHHGVLRWLY